MAWRVQMIQRVHMIHRVQQVLGVLVQKVHVASLGPKGPRLCFGEYHINLNSLRGVSSEILCFCEFSELYKEKIFQ